jgi:hypothetical protein
VIPRRLVTFRPHYGADNGCESERLTQPSDVTGDFGSNGSVVEGSFEVPNGGSSGGLWGSSAGGDVRGRNGVLGDCSKDKAIGDNEVSVGATSVGYFFCTSEV